MIKCKKEKVDFNSPDFKTGLQKLFKEIEEIRRAKTIIYRPINPHRGRRTFSCP